MLFFKKILASFSLTIALLVSANSFAFNLPKEFAYVSMNSTPDSYLPQSKDVSTEKSLLIHSITKKKMLMSQYSKWKGTRYLWGGETKNGVDCSALMRKIFNDSFTMTLPRNTFQQIKKGRKVDKDSLEVGDLVFFKTEPEVRHVGVYIGDDEFIHASSSKGVTISSLTHEYWKGHYETARRVII